MNTRLLILLALLGCKSEKREPPLPGHTPFAELHGVELGITADELIRVRPVTFVPYVGFRDSVGSEEILYWFPHGHDKKISSNSRLDGLTSHRLLLTAPQARDEWKKSAKLLRETYGNPVSCREFTAHNKGFAATWKLPTGRLHLSAHLAEANGTRVTYVFRSLQEPVDSVGATIVSCQRLM